MPTKDIDAGTVVTVDAMHAKARVLDAVRSELDALGERLGLVLTGTPPARRQRVITSELADAIRRIGVALDIDVDREPQAGFHQGWFTEKASLRRAKARRSRMEGVSR